LVACENKDEQAGYIAMEAVEAINRETVQSFVKKTLQPAQIVRSDALVALNIIEETQHQEARVTPAEKVDAWVHIAIGNLKTFPDPYSSNLIHLFLGGRRRTRLALKVQLDLHDCYAG